MKKDSAVEWLFNELLGDRVLSKELIELREQALELEKQQQLDLTNITRLEVINHASNSPNKDKKAYFEVTYNNSSK
jgi:hypothetical protein